MNTKTTDADYQDRLKAVLQKMEIPETPTMDIGHGIRLDFCYGLRILFPHSLSPQKYKIKIVDLDHSLVMGNDVVDGGEYYLARWRYFMRYGIQITHPDFGTLRYEYDAKDQDVLIRIPVRTIGDSIAWFSSIPAFQRKHQCKLHVCMPDYVAELFRDQYPDIHFVTDDERRKLRPYAVYTMGIFMDDAEMCNAPTDYRQCSLHHYGAHLLGMDPEVSDIAPMVKIGELVEPIREPYVCISSYGSGLCKNWMNPDGWPKVVQFLKDSGYRVLDIDRHVSYGSGIYHTQIPRNAEDFTGDFPLSQRAALLDGADFFVGLPSGLSWLAWCLGTPVVMISGFSLPETEFYTPYRVINRHVCHGCYADMREKFVPEEFDWCPRHKGTSRHYECTRGISSDMVLDAIRSIPNFIKHQTKGKEE